MGTRRAARHGSVQDLWTDKDSKRTSRYGRGKRWRARYVNEFGVPITKAFDRKGDGETWLDNETTSRVTGTYVDPRNRTVTVGEFYADWSPRQRWVDGYREAMDMTIRLCPLRDMELGDLNRKHCQEWVRQMEKDQKLAKSTVVQRFNNLHNVIKAAMGEKYLGTDPAKKTPLPRVTKAVDPAGIPTPGELRQLLSVEIDIERMVRRPGRPRSIHQPHVGKMIVTMIYIAAFAGLRGGEILGLQLRDIDFLRKDIHVRRQVQRATGKPMEVREPKSKEGRTVHPNDELFVVISQYIASLDRKLDQEDWLFVMPLTRVPPFRQQVAQWMRDIKAVAGLSHRQWSMHDMRHFYASGLIAQKCDVKEVQVALGHSTPSITLDTYTHLWPKHDDRVRRAGAGLWSEVIIPAPSSVAHLR